MTSYLCILIILNSTLKLCMPLIEFMFEEIS